MNDTDRSYICSMSLIKACFGRPSIFGWTSKHIVSNWTSTQKFCWTSTTNIGMSKKMLWACKFRFRRTRNLLWTSKRWFRTPECFFLDVQQMFVGRPIGCPKQFLWSCRQTDFGWVSKVMFGYVKNLGNEFNCMCTRGCATESVRFEIEHRRY